MSTESYTNPDFPSVSVIIPNYNYARFLELRIESVLKQTYKNFELILLDDASTDNSVEILTKYKDNPYVSHLIINKTNTQSPFCQWMKGISLAKGEWIWIAEADDLCEANFLEVCMNYIQLCPQAVLCNVANHYINEKGNIIPHNYNQWEYQHTQSKAICFDGKKYAEHVLYWENTIPNASGVIFKKKCVSHIKDSSWQQLRYCGDWLFWAYIALQGQVIQVREILNYFRQHQSQSTIGISKGKRIIEDMTVTSSIEKLITAISQSKQRLRRGKHVRTIHHIKDIIQKKNAIIHYQQLFHHRGKWDYLYYKLHHHFYILPGVLTEEKDREKAKFYSIEL